MYFFVCVLVFVTAYLVNSMYITVFYHRGLCHRGLTLKPGLRRFVVATGNWVTGLDPKGWVCMHRMHHEHSDTEHDPHSPSNTSIRGVFLAQHKAYERVLMGLHRGKDKYTQHVSDLDFGVHWLNTHRLWWLPFAIHFTVGALVGSFAGMPLLGACYFFGLMCHPIQGWLVNSFGHAIGPRNFDTPDNSRNNAWVAWLVVGEGLQNNHHAYPASAKLAYAPGEPDLGYKMCLAFETLGLLAINQSTMIPAYGTVTVEPEKPHAALSRCQDALHPLLKEHLVPIEGASIEAAPIEPALIEAALIEAAPDFRSLR